jgi:hypothetical protein
MLRQVDFNMTENFYVKDVFEKSGREKGLYIEFYSCDSCHIDDIFSLNYDGVDRYFIVAGVRTDDGRLLVQAKEYGYYNSLFRDSDIRILLASKVVQVVDKELIKKLARENCYC